jgi:hypothetical protein
VQASFGTLLPRAWYSHGGDRRPYAPPVHQVTAGVRAGLARAAGPQWLRHQRAGAAGRVAHDDPPREPPPRRHDEWCDVGIRRTRGRQQRAHGGGGA